MCPTCKSRVRTVSTAAYLSPMALPARAPFRQIPCGFPPPTHLLGSTINLRQVPFLCLNPRTVARTTKTDYARILSIRSVTSLLIPALTLNTPRLTLATSITALLALSAAPSGQAATQYWDPVDAGTIATVTAGSGAWDTATPNWTDATTATTAFATFVNGSTAVFAGTGAAPSTTVNTNAGADAAAESYVVTLGSAITTGPVGATGGIFFNNTGFLLTSTAAQTITNLSNVTIAAGKSASIGGSLTLDLSNANNSPSVTLGNGSVFNVNTGATLSKSTGTNLTRGLLLTTGTAADSGTFNVAGTVSYNFPTATTGALVIGQTAGTTTVNVNNGGLLTSNNIGASGIGSIVLSNAGATAILNVNNGGNVSTTNTTSAFAGIEVGRVVGGSSTVNLNGGTITTSRVFKVATATGTFNFNGGTLTANVTNNTDFMTGLTRANVSAGGAVINTAGFNVTIGQNLLNSNVAGDAGTGGLTKNGAGTLTLTGANTYTGATTVNAGTLAASATTGSKALGSTTSIAIKSGTLLLGTANQVNTATVVPITMGTATTTGILAVASGANQGSAATVTGGAPAVGGPSAAGLGTLTLANTSTLTYSGAATTLVFGLFNPAGNLLNITGYSNATFDANQTSSGGANDDRLVFSGTAGSVPTTSFAFNGNAAGFGVKEIALDNGFYEVTFTAVPEPSAWVGGLLGLGVIGFTQRRRLSAARQI